MIIIVKVLNYEEFIIKLFPILRHQRSKCGSAAKGIFCVYLNLKLKAQTFKSQIAYSKVKSLCFTSCFFKNADIL